MARTGKFASVPPGWCWRAATQPGDKGLPISSVHAGSMRPVYRKKDLMIVYGCPKGQWRPGGKYRVKKGKKIVTMEGKCTGSMRAVKIVKPWGRVKKSKHRSLYHCKR